MKALEKLDKEKD